MANCEFGQFRSKPATHAEPDDESRWVFELGYSKPRADSREPKATNARMSRIQDEPFGRCSDIRQVQRRRFERDPRGSIKVTRNLSSLGFNRAALWSGSQFVIRVSASNPADVIKFCHQRQQTSRLVSNARKTLGRNHNPNLTNYSILWHCFAGLPSGEQTEQTQHTPAEHKLTCAAYLLTLWIFGLFLNSLGPIICISFT